MLYLDASIVVAIFTSESQTARLQQWIEDKRGEIIAVSRWVDVEFAAALAAKARAGALDESGRDKSLKLYRQAVRENFTLLEIGERQFQHAERLARNTDLGLRGGDALHLAVVADNRAALCTLDKRQAEGAAKIGIPVELA